MHGQTRRSHIGSSPRPQLLPAQQLVRQIAHAEAELIHRQREFAYHLLDVAVKALLEFQHAAALVVRIVEHAGNAVEL